MTSTVFVDYSPQTPIVAAWLNDVNTATYTTIPSLQTQIAALSGSVGGLSASNGATLIGYKQTGTGTVARTVAQKVSDWLSAEDFAGVDPTGTTDSTAGLTAWLTQLIATGRGGWLSGTFKVTNLIIPQGNLNIVADATLLGATTGTFSSVLEIKNATDLTIAGRLLVSASYNTGYAAGIKVWANVAGGCSLLSLRGLSVSSAQNGWQIGDSTQPDALVSEISIEGGYTFGCPTAVLAIGTQVFVNFVGYILEATYGGGSGAWLSLPLKAVIAVGANVVQTGGELLQATSSVGSGVEIHPIASTSFPNAYGTYRGVGVTIEVASQFAGTANPGAVASPVNGLLSFVQCTGIHTQNVSAIINTDSQFTGRIICQANNFYATVARTIVNIFTLAGCDIYCDDMSFGQNFLPALAGISGPGVPHFSQRMILSVSNCNGEFFPASTLTNVTWIAQDNSGDLAHFSAGMVLATGIFTVPAGGLKNIEVIGAVFVSAITAGQLLVYVNGVLAAGGFMDQYGQVKWSISHLAAGSTIQLKLINLVGSSNAGATSIDQMNIFASN